LRIAVVGAGAQALCRRIPGGDLGMQVALIDPEANPGGVMFIPGCIPSKRCCMSPS